MCRVLSRMRAIWEECGDDLHRIRSLFVIFSVEELARSRRRCCQARDRKNRGFCRDGSPATGCVLTHCWSLPLTIFCQVCGDSTPSIRRASHCCNGWIPSLVLCSVASLSGL